MPERDNIQAADIFGMTEQFERDNPGISEAMRVLGVSMDQYEASLAALYQVKYVITTSTEELYAHLG